MLQFSYFWRWYRSFVMTTLLNITLFPKLLVVWCQLVWFATIWFVCLGKCQNLSKLSSCNSVTASFTLASVFDTVMLNLIIKREMLFSSQVSTDFSTIKKSSYPLVPSTYILWSIWYIHYMTIHGESLHFHNLIELFRGWREHLLNSYSVLSTNLSKGLRQIIEEGCVYTQREVLNI